MYCRPPTVLSLERSRPSTTLVPVGSTILSSFLVSGWGCGLLLSGAGAGGVDGSAGLLLLLSSLPPQAATPRATMMARDRLVSFIFVFSCFGWCFPAGCAGGYGAKGSCLCACAWAGSDMQRLPGQNRIYDDTVRFIIGAFRRHGDVCRCFP